MRPCISIHTLTRISRTHGDTHAQARASECACACAAATISPSRTMPHGQKAQPIAERCAAPAPRWVVLTNDDQPPPDPTVCVRLRGRGCAGKGRAPACVRGAGSLCCFDDLRTDAMIPCHRSTYCVCSFWCFVCVRSFVWMRVASGLPHSAANESHGDWIGTDSNISSLWWEQDSESATS